MSNPLPEPEGNLSGLSLRRDPRRAGWALLAAVVSLGVTFVFDDSAVTWVHANGSGIWREVAAGISYWGDFFGIVGLAAIAWILSKCIGNRAMQSMILKMVACAVFSGLIANVIRAGTGRSRPSNTQEAEWHGITKGFRASRYQSFPSAHTAVVAGFVGPLVVMAFRGGLQGRQVIGVVFAFASASGMGWARVRVGQHHPSDVVAAMWLGTVFSFWWMNRYAPVVSSGGEIC